MVDKLGYLLISVAAGSICGACAGICSAVLKCYIDSKNHKTDVENITKNILHKLDEENGNVLVNKVDYMSSRTIV